MITGPKESGINRALMGVQVTQNITPIRERG
uniref:Uncharacterized protein n=2 Tax=unclassified bacterial viruses TaxID=12333 RepID=A0AAU8KZL7_9VIRU